MISSFPVSRLFNESLRKRFPTPSMPSTLWACFEIDNGMCQARRRRMMAHHRIGLHTHSGVAFNLAHDNANRIVVCLHLPRKLGTLYSHPRVN
jgi:hypothetical protein